MAYTPTSITPLAQGYVPFAGASPTRQLWVSPTGNDANSGTAAAPFKTISAAMLKTVPGDAVMVKAGSYTDSVRMKSGTVDKPVWLISADGEGAATITGKLATAPVVYGFGNDNMVVKGFKIAGGMDGIKFTQGGTNLVNPADNIVLQDNTIYGQSVDGIKVAQARNAVVVANTVRDLTGVDEAIDIFYTRNGIVANNDIDRIPGQGGIVVKAGSEAVRIMDNDIAGVQRGIVVGGWAGGNGESWPADMGWQAKGLWVEGNLVQNTTKWAVITQGAIDSTITKNAFYPNNTYPQTAATGPDDHGWQSRNIKFIDNIVQKSPTAWLADGSKAVTTNTGNVQLGTFDKADVGPNALDGSASSPPPPLTSGGSAVPVRPPPAVKDGGAVAATINGTAAADTLTGTAKNEYIDGAGSHDTMSGLAGDDIYIVGSIYDKAIEQAGAGTDSVRAWVDAYTLPGNVENLVIVRAAGATVRDNASNNILTGSAGADTFVFGISHGHDLIRSFKVGTDHIKIDTHTAADMKVAQTAAGDMILTHDSASITLAGVDPHTAITSLF